MSSCYHNLVIPLIGLAHLVTSTSISLSLPEHCKEYMVLDAADRSSTNANDNADGGCFDGNEDFICKCDDTDLSTNTLSPDWQGTGIYLLMFLHGILICPFYSMDPYPDKKSIKSWIRAKSALGLYPRV